METVIIEEQSYSTTIWLNRPDKRNAFNAKMINELTTAIKQAISNKKNRCIVIRGKGKVFSAGADLNYMKDMSSFSEAENIEDSIQLFTLFETIYNCPIPTISYVHGASFGGSNGIIAACDYSIAHTTTKFSFSEVKLGLLPATISPFVYKKIGESASLQLMMTGQVFETKTAKEVNLIQEIVSNDADIENAISSFIHHFITASPTAVKQTKALIRQLNGKPIANTKQFTANLIAKARVSEDGQEGITAFFNKRKPNWSVEIDKL